MREKVGVTVQRGAVRRGMYRDSVLLMRVAQDLRARDGVSQAEVLIATPSNLRALGDAALLPKEILNVHPTADDLVVVLEGQEAAVELALRDALAILDGDRPFGTEPQVDTARRTVRS